MPGIQADDSLARQFRYEVAGLLGRQPTSFPGAQPVSFGRRHLEELKQRDYYVCEKSDGIRCLMYMSEDAGQEIVYLIDRKNDFYYVPHLHFPVQDSEKDFHRATLVDGELVLDTQVNGTTVLRYLIFDCLVLDGISLVQRTLDKRLGYFAQKVIEPYKKLYKDYPDEIQYLPFQIELKEMQNGYGIEHMFRMTLPNLPHGNDGLIFTCRTTPYESGTDPNILKWKTSNENSVDFRMQLVFPKLEESEDDDDQDPGPHPDYDAFPQINLMVYTGGSDFISFGQLGLDRKLWEWMKGLNEPLNDRIVECCLDKSKVWRFSRWRDDKKEANYISTVQSVMESIGDNVSEQDLIKAARDIRTEWKKRQAAQEGKAKQEMEAKRAHMAAQADDSAGSGVKRKFEGGSDD